MKKINKRNNESKYGKCFGMLVLILTLFQSAYSQETLDQYVKRIVPSSPEVASIIKYGDYPISHTTGIPEINIPLYTVECDEVTVPISISYHSSGTKTNDIASVVGLGWTLNAGGMIHRTVNGLPDDLSSSAKNNRFVLKSEARVHQHRPIGREVLRHQPLCLLCG